MAKKYKCMFCDNSFERPKLIAHINKNHSDMLPEGYTGARLVFDKLNKNTVGHGNCRVCGRPTNWDERINRYSVLCDDPLCRQKMREEYKKNMLRVRGTYNILNDPEQQKLMLSNRKISGIYNHSDGGKIAYTGTYEKKFLEFIDVVMNIPSKDIISPGPTMEYTYKGQKHIYIPDFYYLPYNIIIEIKDGGDNANTQHSIGRDSSREKTIEKERIITDRGEYNYIRLTNNQFVQFLEVIMSIKDKIMNGDESKTIRINESYEDILTAEYIIESNLSNEIKHIKSPEDLLEWVSKNIKYSHINQFNTPEDVLKSKSGDCHDQAYLLHKILKGLGYDTGRLFLVEYKEWNTPGGATHTVCWYKEDDKYKWIETAWGDLVGIHGPFDTLDDLKDYIKAHWKWSEDNDKLYIRSTSVKPPMSFENYVIRNTPENNPKNIYNK